MTLSLGSALTSFAIRCCSSRLTPPSRKVSGNQTILRRNIADPCAGLKILGDDPRLQVIRTASPPGRTIKDLDPRNSLRPAPLHPVLILVLHDQSLATKLQDGMPELTSSRNHGARVPLTVNSPASIELSITASHRPGPRSPRQIGVPQRQNQWDRNGGSSQTLETKIYAKLQPLVSARCTIGPVTVWCRSFDHVMCSKGDEPWAQSGRMNFVRTRCGSR